MLDADSSAASSLSSSVSQSGTSTVNAAALLHSSTGAPDSTTSAHHAPASGPSTSMTTSSIAANSSTLAPSTVLLLDINTPSTSAAYSTKSVHEAPGTGAIASVTSTTVYTNSSISVQASTASSIPRGQTQVARVQLPIIRYVFQILEHLTEGNADLQFLANDLGSIL